MSLIVARTIDPKRFKGPWDSVSYTRLVGHVGDLLFRAESLFYSASSALFRIQQDWARRAEECLLEALECLKRAPVPRFWSSGEKTVLLVAHSTHPDDVVKAHIDRLMSKGIVKFCDYLPLTTPPVEARSYITAGLIHLYPALVEMQWRTEEGYRIVRQAQEFAAKALSLISEGDKEMPIERSQETNDA